MLLLVDEFSQLGFVFLVLINLVSKALTHSFVLGFLAFACLGLWFLFCFITTELLGGKLLNKASFSLIIHSEYDLRRIFSCFLLGGYLVNYLSYWGIKEFGLAFLHHLIRSRCCGFLTRIIECFGHLGLSLLDGIRFPLLLQLFIDRFLNERIFIHDHLCYWAIAIRLFLRLAFFVINFTNLGSLRYGWTLMSKLHIHLVNDSIRLESGQLDGLPRGLINPILLLLCQSFLHLAIIFLLLLKLLHGSIYYS